MLSAIENWGLEAALTRFAGMFAFGLWDLKTRTLHLARDRMGKKPLYVASTRDALIFASELKAISRFPSFVSSSISMPPRRCFRRDGYRTQLHLARRVQAAARFGPVRNGGKFC